jgi:hypothetical protein
MQAAVDAHAVARIWQVLRDGGFVDQATKELHFRAAIFNARARTYAFWHQTVRSLSSGTLSSRAWIENMPVYSVKLRSGKFSGHGLYVMSLNVILFSLCLLHTAFVSGFLPWVTEPNSRQDPQRVMHAKSSRWFRILCQVSVAVLAVLLFKGISANGVVLRMAEEFNSAAATSMSQRISQRTCIMISGHQGAFSCLLSCP